MNKQEKIKEEIRHLAAEYLNIESNRTSLLTVTNIQASADGKYATVFLSVFPKDKEKAAVEFANRKSDDFREYLKKKSRIGRIPFIKFEIDFGEKNRQKIDDLSDKT